MLSLAMTFSPDNHDAFLDALRPVWAACAAEPECLLFDVFASPGQKGRFRIVEVWKGNREWFEQVQLKKSYYGPYMDVVGPILVARELDFTERLPGWLTVKDEYVHSRAE